MRFIHIAHLGVVATTISVSLYAAPLNHRIDSTTAGNNLSNDKLSTVTGDDFSATAGDEFFAIERAVTDSLSQDTNDVERRELCGGCGKSSAHFDLATTISVSQDATFKYRVDAATTDSSSLITGTNELSDDPDTIKGTVVIKRFVTNVIYTRPVISKDS
ncbi:hypothetical protein C8R43DRAFT_1144497 [Mycena crocata]|nr:hypothetical protein C8R43DRAFT_1144497 [Mycena crocata]